MPSNVNSPKNTSQTATHHDSHRSSCTAPGPATPSFINASTIHEPAAARSSSSQRTTTFTGFHHLCNSPELFMHLHPPCLKTIQICAAMETSHHLLPRTRFAHTVASPPQPATTEECSD
ncbi:hypothetical protein DEO72_LG7g1190 [Vigna unguiculata]|uniref:Uncharacterized protein n=1 Tax=Vigna unguiculata TaxID=3917 RepID=A0A4D6MGI4_VIGUN|nr:hypothetical protein DEO72_LG7g1190 [Vigna unguiculata]